MSVEGVSILLAPPHYPPAAPAWARIGRVMANRFAEVGIEVSVFTSMPSYFRSEDAPVQTGRCVEDGVPVTRVTTMPGGSSLSRVIGGLVFGAKLIAHTAWPRRSYDIVVVQTVPPVVMGICGWIAARLAGAKLVYHAMDIHPDAATASGDLEQSVVLRGLRFLDTATMGVADSVVVLSEDMRRTVEERGIETSKIAVINNFNPVPVESADSLSPDGCRQLKEPGPVRFVFAGNLGRFQNLDALIEGFRLAEKECPNIELLLIGEGVRKSELEQLALSGPQTGIRFIDQQSPEAALLLLQQADFAVVSLASGMLGSCYPSKVMAYLEVGCPIISIVDPDTELATMTVEEHIGFTCAPGDRRVIADTLLTAAASQRPSSDLVRAVGERRFGRAGQLELWLGLVEALSE